MREVKKLSLYFRVERKLSKDEIRFLLLDCVHKMVKNVHACEAIQPYLLEEGFSEKNVEITLFFTDGRKELYYPDIMCGGYYSGELKFKTKVPEDKYGYHTKEKETYEEALALLEAQGKVAALTPNPARVCECHEKGDVEFYVQNQ